MYRRAVQSGLHSLAAASLSLLLVAQSLPVEGLAQASLPAAKQDAPKKAEASAKLAIPRIDPGKTDADPRILHLLNRFTFGATPADIAEVREMGNKGLDRWFEQQLEPERIPQTAGDVYLDAQLAAMPAMQLPVEELLGTFPSGAVIRQAASGKFAVPQDPYLYAIYQRHIALQQEAKAKKAEAEKEKAGAQAGVGAQGMAAGVAGAAERSDMGSIEVPKTEEANMEASSKPGLPAKMDAAPNQPGTGQPVTNQPAANQPGTNGPGKTVAPDPARPSYSDLLVKSVLALPPGQRAHRILLMQPVEYQQFQNNLRGAQKTELLKDMAPQDRELVNDFENPTRAVIEELETQRLLRDIYSSHQLQEVMTTFWLNHFNVFLHKNEETPYYLVSFERDVIRPNALGNFEDLLVATAKSPAMLLYLDNSSSTGPDSEAAAKQREREKRVAIGKPLKAAAGLNENYARELMELHTLGVNGGYTQQDVTEVAKVFTGWTVDHPQLGGGFEFDETRHEPGDKRVLGHKIKEHGQREGLDLLHMLASSPATAHFISQELAVAFVSDNPPSALVDRMAKSFLSSHGEISDVLRTMVRSPEFWAPETFQAKVKTPLEYVISAARASHVVITNPRPLVSALNQMGMPLYGCVPPTGYSLKADAWVSTGELVTRMNFALSLATNKFGGVQAQWTEPNQATTTPTEAEQELEARLVPGGVSGKTRAAVLDQVQAQAQAAPQSSGQSGQSASPAGDKQVGKPNAPKQNAPGANAPPSALEKQNAQIAGLLLGSPEFQRR